MKKYVDSSILVDAYMIPSDEVDDYICRREELSEKLLEYATSLGVEGTREGQGSQDGEYIHIENEPCLYLLDPFALEIWEQSNGIKDFVKKYQYDVSNF